MKFVSIIPARKNSKSIPNKNLVLLDGKPLIQYSIEQSLENQLETYVLSDCEYILEFSRKHGANGILQNSIGDNTNMDQNLIDFIYPKFKGTHIILLQPTSPIRGNDIINRCINSYDGQSLITTSSFGTWVYKLHNGVTTPLFNRFNRPLKQDNNFITYKFCDGNVIIRNCNLWYIERCIVSDNPVLFQNEYLNSLQVDTLNDLEVIKTYKNIQITNKIID